MPNKIYVPEIQEVISSGRVLNVLIVDDSKVVRTAIREILELGNIQVTEAIDGVRALEAVSIKMPDLVLLDVVMPGVDGINVLRKLRESYSKLQLPIVLVTSRGESNEIVQALDFGANDYVTKPIDFDVLWARISNQLMQKQAAEYLKSAQSNLEDQIKIRTSELDESNQQLKNEIEVRLLAESQLQRQANFDELTGLPNRSLAMDRLNQTLTKAKRHTLKPCLAFLDLDNFKYINDTFGHAAGDDLLIEVSQRLNDCARESDTVARLGGDEFLLILDDDNKIKQEKREVGIRHIGERIIESFSKPFIIGGHELNVTPSLGFAIYPKDGDDSNVLMRHADAAMYRSKHDGKNAFCFFSPEMTLKAKLRMNIESHLRHALERDELSICYQPIIDGKSGRISKAEALLKWDCKELGMISPDCFIPIAEETGLINTIGSWTIREVCRQAKQWRDAGLDGICIAINVTANQLKLNAVFVETLKSSINENNLTMDAVELELTESILMKATDEVNKTIKQLETIGVKLSIDDFGAEYASISYLQRHEINSIKMDRSYMENILSSNKDERLVRAVISMAKSLAVSIVCNGVDNKEQYDFLKEENCELMQGDYFSKPISSNEFLSLVQKASDNNLDRIGLLEAI